MSKRDFRLFVNDIKESCEAIFEYVKELNFDEFIEDRKTYSAVIREFEIIGEATKYLPTDITDKYSDIGWRDIKDFRNLLIHEYFGVDFEIVWNTIKDDLPKLYKVIQDIKNLLEINKGVS
ncbi:MAG: DUF86 domain-containing protein [Campylobacterales bacterium]|nr:DUF86 domain-containing protein [Campylobacterales bacterium]